MARYFAEIKGKRGAASREGSQESGIWSHTRGWDLGVEVFGFNTAQTNGRNYDQFTVYLTSGTNGGKKRCLGTFSLKDLKEG